MFAEEAGNAVERHLDEKSGIRRSEFLFAAN
jgi:hypothetical protein